MIGRITLTMIIIILAMANVSAQAPENDMGQISRGYDVYQYWCIECHGSGHGKPGTAGLAYKYKGQLPGLLTERTDLVPDLIRQYVREGIYMMPFFRKTEISDADLEALTAFLVN